VVDKFTDSTFLVLSFETDTLRKLEKLTHACQPFPKLSLNGTTIGGFKNF